MEKRPDNVVLTRAAAQALCAEFVGWQCRVRQFAARQDGGRPSAGMRPRVTTPKGDDLAPAVVVLITEADPEHSTQQFKYQYLKTQDPNERYDKVLEFLQAGYFQDPARFSDVLTALFAQGSELAAQLLERGQCVLEFEQGSQGYRIPCAVMRLPAAHPRHQATYWHNRLFNENLPPLVEVLAFTPDWAHAAKTDAR
ncbi:MAG TPA: hypothetical protein VH183_06205 [Burkholderiaceae bacterium]|jgi:hypothetical protein|nr:hypothetical protein [Burkholderiaceae bacterium]